MIFAILLSGINYFQKNYKILGIAIIVKKKGYKKVGIVKDSMGFNPLF